MQISCIDPIDARDASLATRHPLSTMCCVRWCWCSLGLTWAHLGSLCKLTQIKSCSTGFSMHKRYTKSYIRHGILTQIEIVKINDRYKWFCRSPQQTFEWVSNPQEFLHFHFILFLASKKMSDNVANLPLHSMPMSYINATDSLVKDVE